MSNTILINDVSINGNKELNSASKLSETLQENTVNALGVDASSRTIWVNGQPYGNAYVNITGNNVEAPMGAEIFNDFANNVATAPYSHAEGTRTKATGDRSHAEGYSTTAEGGNSHAEGTFTTAMGDNSHAEGSGTTAKGTDSHAEGAASNKANIEENDTAENIISKWNTTKFSLAHGDGSHVEGKDNLALGDNSHAEGEETIAKGDMSHAEGIYTTAEGDYSHAEGSGTTAKGCSSHAEGRSTTAEGSYSHTEGDNTKATGDNSHAEGVNTIAKGNNSHAEGSSTNIANIDGNDTEADVILEWNNLYNKFSLAYGENSHVEGKDNLALGDNSHAEGEETIAKGDMSHAEGIYTTAEGDYSHAEGFITTANGESSHAEGDSTTAQGDYSHAEGYSTSKVDLESIVTEGEELDTTDILRTWAKNDKFSLAYGDSSHVEGKDNLALGFSSHAEGYMTTANGNYSHTEGGYTAATGECSHAEGGGTTAAGGNSHAEGSSTTKVDLESIEQQEGDENFEDAILRTWTNGVGENKLKFSLANGNSSHVEGKDNLALGFSSHAEGYATKSIGSNSHAEGLDTLAAGNMSHAEGTTTKANGMHSHAEGCLTTAKGDASHVEGWSSTSVNLESIEKEDGESDVDSIIRTWTDASTNNKFSLAYGQGSHVEGKDNLASGDYSHAEGYLTKANGIHSHAEGSGTTAKQQDSHAEGSGTTANGPSSHAEGAGTIAEGWNSHAEGCLTTAIGDNSHAEGLSTRPANLESITQKEGDASFEDAIMRTWSEAEYKFSLAFGNASHVEGLDNLALRDNSHAEGGWTKAYGPGSHAEGASTISKGLCSHAEGYDTTAQGSYSHAEGEGTITTLGNDAEHAQGRYNASNTNTIHSVGIGTSINDRKNAYEILKTGEHYIYNLGGYDGTNPSVSKDIATILSTVDTSDIKGFTVEKTLTVTGGTTLSDLDVHDVLVMGDLDVDGTSTLNNLTASNITATGRLTIGPNKYPILNEDDTLTDDWGLDCNNSDVISVNSLVFNRAYDATEGILFGNREGDAYSSMWIGGEGDTSEPYFSRNVQRLIHQDDLNMQTYNIYYSGANLKPSTNGAYDIGTSNYRFKHLYLSGNIYSNADDGGIIFNQAKKVYIKIKNGKNNPSIVSYDPTTENTGATVAFGTSTLTTDIKGSTITLNGTTTVANSLTVSDGKLTTLGGILTVKGTTTFNGDVTIGSGNTSANLTVFGSGTFDSSITAVTSFVLSKKDGSNYTQFINANVNSNSFSVGFGSTSTLNFKGAATFTSGAVTIGVDSDTGNQNLTVYGNALATAFYERSDATKKDVVSNLDVDFDKLKQIPKVNFTWKNDTEKKNNIGTIAQELNKVYPELVNGEEGNMTVDYAKLSIIALAAIDKLEDRIKQLEDKLQQYEK